VLGYTRMSTISSTEIEAALEEISATNPNAKGADPKQLHNTRRWRRSIKKVPQRNSNNGELNDWTAYFD
jgi:hypothetical protein